MSYLISEMRVCIDVCMHACMYSIVCGPLRALVVFVFSIVFGSEVVRTECEPFWFFFFFFFFPRSCLFFFLICPCS